MILICACCGCNVHVSNIDIPDEVFCDDCAVDESDGVADDDDGQPTEYEEWQDYMGGDDWDQGQFDTCDDF